MLIWRYFSRWLVCLVCLAMAAGSTAVFGQDAQSPSATPPAAAESAAAESAAPPPAAPVPEAEPAEPAPAQPEPAPVVAQDLSALSLSRLAHPSVADQLELSDEQRASVARLLNERAAALAAASPNDQAAIVTAANQKLAALLSDPQRAALAAMATPQKLRFNFRGQRWDEVLDWFARQAGLALVMAKAPEGTFTYSDNRAYTPTEAIDLLNSVLLTKGMTLIRRERMLVLINMSSELPLNLIPRITPEEIQGRGNFEVVSVMFPIGARPADAVVKEITPLLGNYGKITALPATKQLLITETAGKLRAITIVLASIPEPKPPKKPEPKPKPPPKPKPVLTVYTVAGISKEAALKTLTELFEGAKFTIDDKADQVFAFATPSEQTAIKAAVDKMIANDPPDKQPHLEIYSLGNADPEQLQEQLTLAIPDAQITVDPARRRVLVFGAPKTQETVAKALEKLGVTLATGDQHIVVYQVKQVDPQTLSALVTDLLPSARVTVEEKARRVVVSAAAGDQVLVKALVEQLEQEMTPEQQTELRVYPLEEPIDTASVSKLQTLVPDAEVSLSADAGQLMVVARPEDQAKIKAWIDQWQQAMAMIEKPELKIYPLEKPLNATDLTTLKTLNPTAKVTLSADSRQLTVVATATKQTAVTELLTELLDAASQVEKPELKIYPLEKPLRPTDLATLTALNPQAKVTLSTDSLQLTVVATAAKQAAVSKLLTQLLAAASQIERPEFKVYPLEKTLSAADVATIQSLVPEAKLTLATDGRQLTVVAPPSKQTSVSKLITELVAAVSSVEKPTLKIYPLKKPLDASVMTTLQALAATAKVSVSTDGKRLVVVATENEQEVIKTTLDQIEASAGLGDDRQLEIYQIRGFTATELQTLLQPVVTTATITVDAALDRLIVWGPVDDHLAFAKVIAKLDQNPLAGTKPELRFYPLPSQSLSTSVTTVLLTLAPTAKITWDAQQKRLMVIAPPKDHEVVRQTIEQITENAADVEEQTLKLYSLNADDRARFDAIEADIMKEYPDMRVIKNPQSSELTVWAQPSQHERFALLLEQLKAAGPADQQRILIGYPIQNGSAETVFTMLQELYPAAKFTLDKKSQRVLALAPLEQHARIKATVTQADVKALPENEEELQSYSVGSTDPASILPMLQSLVPEMTLSVDAVARKVVAWGTNRDQAKLVKVLEQFRVGDPSQRPIVKTYPVEGRNSGGLYELRSILNQVAPDAVLAIDVRGGGIIASARESDHELLQAAIEQVVKMDRESTSRLETYVLKGVSQSRVLFALGRIIPNARVFPGMKPDLIGAWASDRDHELIKASLIQLQKTGEDDGGRELRSHQMNPGIATEATSVLSTTLPDLQILAGQGTDRLLLWGRSEDHDRLDKLIERLEKELGVNEQRELVVYELGDVSQAEARRVLDQSVGGLDYVTGGAEGRLPVRATTEKHERIKKVLDELKKAVELPDQIIKVHKFDDDMNVNTIHEALSDDAKKDLNIQVIVATNSLIVRGSAEQQAVLAEELQQLLTELPKEEQPIIKTYSVDGRDYPSVDRIRRVLSQVVPDAVVTVGVRGGGLVVSALERDHKILQAAMDSIVEMDRASNGHLETYVLKRITSTSALYSLQRIVPGANLFPGARPDLIGAWADDRNHELIQAALVQLEKASEVDDGRELRGHQMNPAIAAQAQSVLSTTLPELQILAGQGTDRLLLWGRPEDHDRLDQLIERMEKEMGVDEQRELVVYELGDVIQAEARRVLDESVGGLEYVTGGAVDRLPIRAAATKHERIKLVLEELKKAVELPEQIIKVHELDEEMVAATVYTALSGALSTDVISRLSIQVDTPTNSLIVRGPAKQQAVFADALKQLLAELPVVEKLEARVYHLERADPTSLSTVLRQLLPGVPLAVDAQAKTLAATAMPKDHKKIESLIEQAEKRLDGDLLIEVYSLKWANAYTVMLSLQRMVPGATIVPDITNKTLNVAGSEKEHALIKKYVEQTDRRGGGELVIKTYVLKFANPAYLLSALTQVVPDAKVTSDPLNKTLIIAASEEDHAILKPIIEESDRRGGGDPIIKSYTLKYANPTYLITALKQVLPDAIVANDPLNKTLIVTASEEDHAIIKPIIEETDQRGGGELTFKSYALKWANPTYLMLSIRTMFPDATFNADAVNKMLIVAASDEDHIRIKGIIDDSDRRSGGDPVVVTYALKYANPAYLLSALTQVVPDAKVTSDPLNKTLIIAASEEDHAILKPIIEESDQRGGGDPVIKSYTLKYANPTYLITALKQVLPDAIVANDPLNKTLIVTASEEDHAIIKPIIEEMDQRGGGELTFKSYALKWANPTYLMLSIRTMFPDATFNADTVNKMLVVAASDEDHIRIKGIIDDSDRRSGGDPVVVTYPLKFASPTYLITALTQVVPDAKVTSDPLNKTLIIAASKEDHEIIKPIIEDSDRRGGGDPVIKSYTLKFANPTYLITALKQVLPDAIVANDPLNKTLIVTASKEDHVIIKPIIEELDQRGGGALTFKSYALKWANPTYLMVSLRPAFPDATFSADAINKMLIVAASDEDHVRIKGIVDDSDRRGGGDPVVETYALKFANPSYLIAALTQVVPDARVSSDPLNKTLIVAASEEDHAIIKTVVEQSDQRGGGDPVVKSYILKYASPTYLITALQQVAPNAIVASDRLNKMLIVTASKEDHAIVKPIVEELDRRGGGDLTFKSYALKWANPSYLMLSLRPMFPDATINSDTGNNMLVVSASEEDHARIKIAVEQSDRHGDGVWATKVYSFKVASPAAVMAALKPLVPTAKMGSDSSTNSLIVTASAEDHKQIEPLVKQLDINDPQAGVLKTYQVESAEPEDVYDSLILLYRYKRTVSISFQDKTGTILVVAPQIEQEEVAKAILDIDTATAGRPEATLEVYSLNGLDGSAVTSALRAVMMKETPKIDLQTDYQNNQVLAFAEPKQHEMIRKALEQLRPEERDVEVFTLKQIDPYAAESAISSLFADLPFAASPTIDSDPGTQKLFIRATKKQFVRIRELLQKMGEETGETPTRSSGFLRVIPMTGDVDATIEQIKRLWPQIRGNDVQVVAPIEMQTPDTKQPSDRSTGQKTVGPAEEPKPKEEPKADEKKEETVKESVEEKEKPKTEQNSDDAMSSGEKSASGATGQLTTFVSVSAPEDGQPEPTGTKNPPEVPADSSPTGTEQDVVTGSEQPAAQSTPPSPALPPLVLIPGVGKLTIVSQDTEALDELERLLQVLGRNRVTSAVSGNFAIYRLQNADAGETAKVLQELMRRGGASSSRYSRYGRRSSQSVMIVADERMNALLVQGTPTQRAVVEEMLPILDSVTPPELLTTEKPRMIPVKNLPASSVLTILSSVYKTHLTGQRGLKRVTIPSGISPQMTSMLELLNAAAEAPLLTLDIDETTNSILLRAPRQLGEEIEEFVQELDEKSKDGTARSINLISLKEMNTKQVQEAINALMRGGGRSYRRGR